MYSLQISILAPPSGRRRIEISDKNSTQYTSDCLKKHFTEKAKYIAKLSKENKTVSWGGRKDGALEQIILKLAVLGPGAKDGRNLVEVTTFDSEQNKIKAIVCALTAGKDENRTLGDLPLFPPANFTLVEGSGPVNIVASHLIMDEDDLSDEDDEDLSDFEESMEDLREKLKAKMAGGKGDAASSKSKKQSKKADELDDDEEEDDDDEDEEENGFIKMESKLADDDDEDEDADDDDYEDMDDDDESDEEEKEQVKVPTKKRKLTNGKSATTENKLTSPERTKKNSQEQKTPVSQKNTSVKTPKSEKKTPAKIKFTSVDEVKAAIKKCPGGKPRKQDKFLNWLGNQYKVTDESWKNDLWVWHKKELGI
uniref:nucleophosmin-like isoform X1 n=1 Tax=Styela clava TaxID=7725 RepID=UPI0019392914|nr:nucleophosmin-like isoform X1 [Styela clava]